MRGKLSSLFRENYRVHFHEDEWASRLQEHLVHQNLDKVLIKNHIQICLKSPCETFWDEVSSLKSFLIVLLFTRSYSLAFQETFLSAKDTLFRKTASDHPLIVLLKTLICELLNLPSPLKDPKNKRLLFEKSPFLPDELRLPTPRIECDIASLCALIGTIQNDPSLKDLALNIAKVEMMQWQRAHLPFFSLWSRSEEHSFWEILLSYYLMTFAVGSLLEDGKLLQKSDVLFKKIAEEVKNSSLPAPVFTALIEEWVTEIKKPLLKDERQASFSKEKFFHFNREKSLGIYQCENWQLALTLQGMNTGIGSLQTQGAEICSFGPQFFPLSSSSGFGIHRLMKKSDLSQDIIYEESENSFFLKGWTRLSSVESSKPTSFWMGLGACVSSQSCRLSFTLVGQPPQEKMAISFYIKAKECRADAHKPIFPKSLNRYFGKAQKVLCLGGDSIEIETLKETSVHIIPLAGKGFFWDADFLVAFEVESSSTELLIHPAVKIS